MKKINITMLLFLPLAVALGIPAADAAWRIVLKNGGEFVTPAYWKEGGEVKFHINGLTVGLKNNSVRKIEKMRSEGAPPEKMAAPPEKVQVLPSEMGKKEAIEKKPSGSAVDINAFRKKKAVLQTELDLTLTRLREATKNGDDDGKERAKQDMRKVSADIYALTEELKKENNGTLPPDWWEKK